MTLGFMQNWPKSMAMQDDKTYFIAKIRLGLIQNKLLDFPHAVIFMYKYHDKFGKAIDRLGNEKPKIHTIRHDESERWKPGMDIHFVINSRTKDRFQFAPVVKCTSVQTIEIIDASHLPRVDGIVLEFPHGIEIFYLAYEVKIDGRFLNEQEIRELAINDGFESEYEFFKYFNKDFKGRLIHWTNLRY
ncbi:hypothetical protein [Sphingobacterium sp. BIGb0116]|uniref:hypothetical protein n=1 Tax=Sphingobacterium sp. BIGb0116 TaxID=2940619 RepID=UPI0021671481|nr:hypothetical protein [Sphingobacterium sp. BIGb0116]MCS4164428.1 hypothetical protein [Sphingobacterium sp. BIGb0116]